MPTKEKSSVREGDHCNTVQNRENLGLKKKKLFIYLEKSFMTLDLAMISLI